MAAEAIYANIFQLETFSKNFQLRKLMEDVLAHRNSCLSSMKTLAESYKVYLRSHKKYLEAKLQNILPTCQEKWQNFHEEILKTVEEISKEMDVIVICDKRSQLDEKVKEWRANTCVEQDILKDIGLVKKKNLQMLRRIHPHTQEFCLRLMSAAEEMKERQRELPKTVEITIREAKGDLQRMIIQKFQQNRLEKLKQVCIIIREQEDAIHKESMTQYNRVRERMRCSHDRVHNKEKEKSKQLAHLSCLPQVHGNKLEEAVVKIRKFQTKQQKLEERNRELAGHRKTSEQTLADEKHLLLTERARLQAVLAKEKALLCQMVKHCKIHGHQITIPGANICAD